ncbi:Sec1-like protein [Aulographum hederae CBS 113979]|uniref:Sec1-like protein n=1 Tax=Aulographum hederae CBS 113979 TaxID=1176131 RepID=A0A6G1GVV0_9PEZI|nr:Sec1-like protein [Aulographum hederae CBS 113979]
MGVSMIETQRGVILDTIRRTAPGEWKVLVVDEDSRKVIDNVMKEDDILNENITNIEQIEQKRPMNPDMDVVYILTAQPHIVDCLMADFERRRYRSAYLIWTSKLPPALRERVDRQKSRITKMQVLNVDYFPRESHVITFRDPWSFPVLYHPACNNLVQRHLADLSEKIVAVCVSLGEYPIIRYYRPRNPLPSHEAAILCSLLAQRVQDELDMWAQYHDDFPAPSSRPRGTLYIVDRSMDLYAPFIHEFTYQAMAFDLLPIKDGEKVTYRTVVNEGGPDEEAKELEISEKDRIWVQNRHAHMKDTIEKLMGDFEKFIKDNPHFTNSNADASSLNAIKDMIAGLPQFQEMKEAYSLHLSMAQEAMNIFQAHKLSELASLEQTLATGLDEDYRKPKNLADQLVRMLDEASITHPDRLRLLALYSLNRDGLVPSDLFKLRSHAQLPPQDEEVIRNLELLGARVSKPLKDQKPPPMPLFPAKPPPPANMMDEYALSRYDTGMKSLLEAHAAGTLDQSTFPFAKPHLDGVDGLSTAAAAAETVSAASLRSAKPTWAKTRGGAAAQDTKQRVIIFMAGGATFSEARECYEVGDRTQRDVVLVTSHMLTPGLFVRQVGDLSVEKRRLGIPMDMPPKKAPAHLFEQEPEAPRPPVKTPYSDPMSPPPMGMGMGQKQPRPMGLSPGPGGLPNGPGGINQSPMPVAQQMGGLSLEGSQNGSAPSLQQEQQNGKAHKLSKDPEHKKKKKHFFSSGKKDKDKS